MKRFHVHVAVSDLGKSIAFYTAVFGENPTVVKPDYAKWMLDDPRVNFAISNRGHVPGVNHLGLQADDQMELEALHANLQMADATVVPERGAQCCYARSDKYWVTDPQGIAWETFRSLGSIPLFGNDAASSDAIEHSLSCGSSESRVSACCAPGNPKSLTSVGSSTGGCCAKP